MKKNAVVNLLINISIAFLGIWIFLNPNVGVSFFRYYLGIILILGALSLLYIYKTNTEKNYKDLVQCIVLLILGIFFLVSQSFGMITLGIIVGVWMVFEAVMNINLALIYRKFNIKFWIVVIIYAALALLGAFFIFQDLNLSALILIKIAAVFTSIRSIIIIIDLIAFQKIYKDNAITKVP